MRCWAAGRQESCTTCCQSCRAACQARPRSAGQMPAEGRPQGASGRNSRLGGVRSFALRLFPPSMTGYVYHHSHSLTSFALLALPPDLTTMPLLCMYSFFIRLTMWIILLLLLLSLNRTDGAPSFSLSMKVSPAGDEDRSLPCPLSLLVRRTSHPAVGGPQQSRGGGGEAEP